MLCNRQFGNLPTKPLIDPLWNLEDPLPRGVLDPMVHKLLSDREPITVPLF